MADKIHFHGYLDGRILAEAKHFENDHPVLNTMTAAVSQLLIDGLAANGYFIPGINVEDQQEQEIQR